MARTDPRNAAPDRDPRPARLETEALADALVARSRALWCVAAAVLGRADGADDVLQEAAIVALERRDQFVPGTNLGAWLATIVRYVALNHARRRRRAPLVGIELPDRAARAVAPPPPVDADGAVRGDQGAFDDAVIAALDHLEETPRSCLLLRVVLDLPYRDIARILDLPEGTAMSHVHRSRAALRARLTPDPEAAP